MDVEAAVALAGAAASGAATAAGESAWQSLVSLARRAAGRAPEAPHGGSDGGGDGVRAVDPSDPDAVREFTARLAAYARQDGDFAARLCEWAETHRAAVYAAQYRDESVNRNIISGDAHIEGPVIQAREIRGDINLG
ncbi:hypothetical protein [Streptomyces boncukensis]|uniref:Uncharacterized protein n=1 Tax=Streptomyces boncukensis TaxID=2711219 RepID=A0A6G4WYS4_9ACTN|nr:hypothetical protein [Streptomyces boncukensis]NGO69581.1 hypothetical protein [Streptomyces boncukensis]